MTSALYYPHTQVQNKGLLKTALLLWDSIDCIVPNRQFNDRRSYAQKVYDEAAEIVMRPRVPNREEKTLAHRDLNNYLRQLPRAFLMSAPDGSAGTRHLIYPDKFMRQTWRLLERGGLAYWDEAARDYGVPPAMGLLMMSVLADACAGKQWQRVTDRVDAYSWLREMEAQQLGAEYITGLDASECAPSYNRLITLSIEALDGKGVPIKKLVAMRKREAKESGSDYRAFRQRYRKSLEGCIERIRKEAKTKNDVREIHRQFKAELRQDLRDLRKELGLASQRALFSKEIALSAVAVGGALIEPISGITTLSAGLKSIGIAPLLKTRAEYRAARRKALRGHDMSWLYLARSGRLSVN